MLDLDRIKSDFSHALRRGCSESKCTLKLGGLGEYVVLKGEGLYRDRKMCDCIIFLAGNSVVIGIVELKSKTAHSTEIIEKLTNSSEAALDILKKCTDSQIDFEFFHIVLCKGWSPSELRKLKNRRIEVRGKGEKFSIVTKRCGVTFSSIVSEFEK